MLKENLGLKHQVRELCLQCLGCMELWETCDAGENL